MVYLHQIGLMAAHESSVETGGAITSLQQKEQHCARRFAAARRSATS